MTLSKNFLAVTIVLFFLGFSVVYGFGTEIAEEETEKALTAIEASLVEFEPQLDPANSTAACKGIARTVDRILLTEDCAVAAWRMIESGVDISVKQGEVAAGILSGLNKQPFSEMVQTAGSGRLVPYRITPSKEQNLTPSALSFPDFVSTGKESAAGSIHYLYISPGQWQDVWVKPSQGNAFGSYTVTSVEKETLSQFRMTGHPVVNQRGQVVCLMNQGQNCQGLGLTGLDDGTCKVPYFQCDDITWEVCEGHKGYGTCSNPTTQSACLVMSWPNHYADHKFQCLHSNEVGCGQISCPIDCAYHSEPINCTCYTAWGFCELTGKTATIPENCMESDGGGGAVNLRCNSGRFLGIVVGTPVAVVAAIGSMAIAGGIIYKLHRRYHYERIN